MKLTKKNKQQIEQWVNALRSGKYEQTQLTLQDKKGYCCLGVACKESIPKEKQSILLGFLLGNLLSEQDFAPYWLQKIDDDFCIKTGKFLSNLNDQEDFTFEEISDLIEAVYLLEVLK